MLPSISDRVEVHDEHGEWGLCKSMKLVYQGQICIYLVHSGVKPLNFTKDKRKLGVDNRNFEPIMWLVTQ